jgi:transcriptional regulator with XRE-family HTH domain
MNKLQSYLTSNKISQRTFAVTIGVDPSIISRLVSRSMTPSLVLAVKIERETDGLVPAVYWIDPATVSAEQGDAA